MHSIVRHLGLVLSGSSVFPLLSYSAASRPRSFIPSPRSGTLVPCFSVIQPFDPCSACCARADLHGQCPVVIGYDSTHDLHLQLLTSLQYGAARRFAEDADQHVMPVSLMKLHAFLRTLAIVQMANAPIVISLHGVLRQSVHKSLQLLLTQNFNVAMHASCRHSLIVLLLPLPLVGFRDPQELLRPDLPGTAQHGLRELIGCAETLDVLGLMIRDLARWRVKVPLQIGRRAPGCSMTAADACGRRTSARRRSGAGPSSRASA